MVKSSPAKKVLLVDDDPVLLGLLSYRLKLQSPELEIVTSTSPEAVSGYDAYIVDNDFAGAHNGARLTERLRLVAPEALILVFSSFLDVPLLKRVANIGADGVFDKREEHDVDRLIERVTSHCEADVPVKEGSRSILRDLLGLLYAWDRKLTREEKARATS